MSEFNVSTSVKFWSLDIVIKEVLSASKAKYFDLQGKTLASFEPGKMQRLEDFKNRYVIQTTDKPFPQNEWMEFVAANTLLCAMLTAILSVLIVCPMLA